MAKIYHTLKKSKELHKIHSKRGRHGQRNTMLKTDENKLKEIRSTDTVLKQERHETSLKETQPRYRAQKEGPLSHSRRKPSQKRKSSMKRKQRPQQHPTNQTMLVIKRCLTGQQNSTKPKKPHYQRRISTHDV